MIENMITNKIILFITLLTFSDISFNHHVLYDVQGTNARMKRFSEL